MISRMDKSKITLAECIAAGIPIYKFGSPELAALHEEALGSPMLVGTRGEGWYLAGNAWCARRTYTVMTRRYEHFRRYVVDHGGFHTLNTALPGLVVPKTEDIAER